MKRWFRMGGLGILAILLAMPLAVYAAGGALDAGFGTGGLVTTDLSNGSSDQGKGVTLQPDGKILVVGEMVSSSGSVFLALVRYNPDGTIDTTFGTQGKVLASILDSGEDVVVQSDGKILVAGEDGTNAAVVRYNSDGTLDTAFGTAGKAVAGSVLLFNTLALQPDGKIVAGGRAGKAFALARFCPNGHLDDGTAAPTGCGGSGFGTGGVVIKQIGNNTVDGVKGLVLQPDGKIVAGGKAAFATLDFAVVRYNSDGTLDTAFGTDGVVVTDLSGADLLLALALQPDGAIVAAGGAGGAGASLAALVRYTPDGSLDSTFGTGGKVTLSAFDMADDVVIQPDGKIVAAGVYVKVNGDADFVVVRLCPNGHLDDGTPAPTGCGGPGFGTGGAVTTDFGSGLDEQIYALALQPDGMMVTVGYSGGDVALARYDGGVAGNPGAVDSSIHVAVEQVVRTLFAHPIRFPSITLTGQGLQVYALSQTWQVRSTATDWHIALSSTDFSDGSGHTIPASGFYAQIRSSDIFTVDGSASPPSPANAAAASGVALNGTVSFLSASGGAGVGTFNFTPRFWLNVPASTVAGDYSATVTVTLAAGP